MKGRNAIIEYTRKPQKEIACVPYTRGFECSAQGIDEVASKNLPRHNTLRPYTGNIERDNVSGCVCAYKRVYV